MPRNEPEAELRKIYGRAWDLHRDLYDASDAHRKAHGEGCDVYPSSPLQAPLWPFLAALTRGRRFLEIGCGLGYTAALMASAGGARCRVDTIESDPLHADLAKHGLARKRLGAQVRVVRSKALDALPKLKGPYDVMFLDGDWREYPKYLPQLIRLSRRRSVIVTANLSPFLGSWGTALAGKNGIRVYLSRLVRDRRFRTYIPRGEWHAYSLRV